MEGLAQPQRLADSLADFGRNGEREARRRVARGEVEQEEDDQADEEQGGDGEEQPPERVGRHAAGPPRPRASGGGRGYFARRQSAAFQSCESQALRITPARVLECAETWPR